jgi:hypothetical protein
MRCRRRQLPTNASSLREPESSGVFLAGSRVVFVIVNQSVTLNTLRQS